MVPLLAPIAHHHGPSIVITTASCSVASFQDHDPARPQLHYAWHMGVGRRFQGVWLFPLHQHVVFELEGSLWLGPTPPPYQVVALFVPLLSDCEVPHCQRPQSTEGLAPLAHEHLHLLVRGNCFELLFH